MTPYDACVLIAKLAAVVLAAMWMLEHYTDWWRKP